MGEMNRRVVNSRQLRKFLIAMITSKQFLASTASVIEPELMTPKYAQLIAGWCVDYWKKYGDVPGRGIESLYEGWVDRDKPEDHEVEAVSAFLETLSDEYDSDPDQNAALMIDQFTKYLNTKKLETLKDAINYSLLEDKPEDAMDAVAGYKAISSGTTGYDPLNQRDVVAQAFIENPTPLVSFPGDGGDFFGQAIVPNSLIAIQGPEKRGKTWVCLEFVYRAIRNLKRVAMFEVGDLSRSQLDKRMFMRMAGVPLWAKQCKGVNYPIGITVTEDLDENGKKIYKGSCIYKTLAFDEPLNEDIARRAQRAFCRRHKVSPDDRRCMFSVHANSSINVRGIDGILNQWEWELGFTPDMIVIDYADILAPEDSRKDAREQINDTWKALRKLSQDWQACVIVPTQANSDSYSATTQSMKHFSNDKRKNAHVTATLGLNQTPQEKDAGIMRLNWTLAREFDFSPSKCLWVAQCIPLGEAFVTSMYYNPKPDTEEENNE